MESPAFCQSCGTGLSAGARFCPRCGTAIASAAGDQPVDGLACGLALLQAGELDRALPLLREAASEGSGFALLAYGTALLRRRRYGDAVEPLERAATLLPERGEPHAYLAMARLHLLDPAGARAAINQALAVAPTSFAVRLKHTELLCRLGYYREALAESEATLRLVAPDAESLAFAERLAALARQKAPQSYTRQPGRFPRLRLPFLQRSRRASTPARVNRPQLTGT
jgi:tetratricopeptide (TPR) repeat protein